MNKTIIILVCVFLFSLVINVSAASWDNGGGDNLWSNPKNWSNDVLPTISDNVDITMTSGPIIDSSTTASGFDIRVGGSDGANLTMNGGTLNPGEWLMIGIDASGKPGTFTMNNGTINLGTSATVNGHLWIGFMSAGTFTMNGGTINVPGRFGLGFSTGGSANTYLNGGTIIAHEFSMTSSCSINITGGILVIDGNQTKAINSYIDNGLIKAPDGTGTVLVDYNITNPGKTTVRGRLFTPQAVNLSPIRGAVNVPITTTLRWMAGLGATSHNIYFGTTSPGTFQGNQTTTTFNPGILKPSTKYYWRIDELSDSDTVVTGIVWNFTTAEAKAVNLSPADEMVNVPLNAELSWTAGAGAVSHDVYFGTKSPGKFQVNQTNTVFNPGTLSANTTYYWRIDEKDSLDSTTTGDVWSFTTGSPPEIHPYLSYRNNPTNSIVVNWWNPIATSDSFVDYGLTDSYGSTTHVATGSHFHHVELTGLSPGTTYHYRIRSSDGTVGTDNTFTTSDVNVTSFSFAVYGDCRGIASVSDSTKYHTRHKQLCDWMAAQDFAFILGTGDIVWGGSISTANPKTKLEVESYYTEFFNAEQNLSRKKVIMHSMGNHEVQPGGRDYTYYYDMYEKAFPTNGPANNKGRVYSFDYGNAHFVCLSSYEIDLNLQKIWLNADLAAARANPNIKWIFAFMHAPIYTTSGHPGRADELAAWGPLFDKYGVDIVFAGHNHLYERSRSIKAGKVVPDGEGTVYITSGLGGAEFNNGSADPKFVCWYGAANLDKTLAVRVTIKGSHLSVEAVPNQTGVPVDSFQLSHRIMTLQATGCYTAHASQLCRWRQPGYLPL